MPEASSDGRGRIPLVPYCPTSPAGLDLEVLTVGELGRRVGRERLRASQRIGFHLLIGVTEGHCDHAVDFTPVACGPGTWVVLRPGQVQRFDLGARWDGWLVVFRPEFVQADAVGTGLVGDSAPRLLSGPIALTDVDHQACLKTVDQMARDAAGLADVPARHALLQSQLRTLRLRLQIAQRRAITPGAAKDASFDLVQRFEQLIDAELSRSHRVGEYAGRLGCAERTLTRATTAVRGVSAKAFLSERIILESKRLLLHTSLKVAEIAEAVGFEEPSNYVKFFRREVGITPGEFRRNQGGRFG